jgi:hypothetical protein
MNPRAIALVSAAVATLLILLVYFLMPAADDRTPQSGMSETSFVQTRQTGTGRLANERSDADSQPERKVQELETRLAKAGSKPPEPKKAKAPFVDPAMRKVLQSDAAAGVKRSVAGMFEAGLAEELQLSPEQQKALEGLLTERGLTVWDQIMIPMATGELDRERMAMAGKSVRQSLELNNAAIRDLLGNEGYAKYERFERAQPDRDSLKQMSPKFAEAGLDLNGDQQGELLGIMAQERARMPMQDFGDPMKIDYGRFGETFSEENTNRYFQEKQQYNERVVREAQRTLTPEQVALLQNVLATQLQRAKFTVRTTRAVMGQAR